MTHPNALAHVFLEHMPPDIAAIYRAALEAPPSGTQVDALLDAHRRAHGEAEQVAYAARPDPQDLRLPLPDRPLKVEDLMPRLDANGQPATPFDAVLAQFGRAGAEQLRDYLQEHNEWKQKPERGLSL